ncbi:hypothetical protein MMC11_009165 [Xylographa trunciseda]|nr:hypothetical protein [Xylographa trunciseda]
MEDPSITLHAKERPSFVWSDGFDGVTDVELKVLLQLSRDTLNSIEAEFESRLISKSSRQAGQIDAYSDRLREGANKIEIQERLDEKAAEHVKAAVKVLTTPQTVRAFMVYRTFLNDVLCQCGPELVLLCAACLGKAKVAALKEGDRISLLDLVKRKKSSYTSPILGRLATEYGIRSLHDKQEKKRKHAESPTSTSAGVTSESTPARETRKGGYTAGSTRFRGDIEDLIHPSPSTKVPERARTNFQMSTMQTTRQIQYMFSKAPLQFKVAFSGEKKGN